MAMNGGSAPSTEAKMSFLSKASSFISLTQDKRSVKTRPGITIPNAHGCFLTNQYKCDEGSDCATDKEMQYFVGSHF